MLDHTHAAPIANQVIDNFETSVRQNLIRSIMSGALPSAVSMTELTNAVIVLTAQKFSPRTEDGKEYLDILRSII